MQACIVIPDGRLVPSSVTGMSLAVLYLPFHVFLFSLLHLAGSASTLATLRVTACRRATLLSFQSFVIAGTGY